MFGFGRHRELQREVEQLRQEGAQLRRDYADLKDRIEAGEVETERRRLDIVVLTDRLEREAAQSKRAASALLERIEVGRGRADRGASPAPDKPVEAGSPGDSDAGSPGASL